MGAIIDFLVTLFAELKILTADPTGKSKSRWRTRSVMTLVVLVALSLLVTFAVAFFPQLGEHLFSLLRSERPSVQ